MKKIYLTLIRHGKTPKSSDQGIFSGQKFDLSLTEAGIEETKILAKKINSHLDKIFCSSLKRSYQTANIITHELENKDHHKTPLIICPEIAEVNMGDFEGLNWEKIERDFPREAQLFNASLEKWKFPRGENYKQLSSRLDTFKTIVNRNTKDEDQILVVGHGLINRLFIYKFFPNEKKIWSNHNYPHDRIVKLEMFFRK